MTRAIMLALTMLMTLEAAAQQRATDIRAITLDLAFYERGREGWTRARAPQVGGMIAMRCTYESDAGADRKPWSVGFMEGTQALGSLVGNGLREGGARSTRIWYARILAPGSMELACVADVDGAIAESNETNNRAAARVDVPAPAARGTAPAVSRATSARRLGTITPRDAAQVRGADPAIDLRFTEAAGVKRAKEQLELRGVGSISAAAVGEALAVNCGYRVHMDAPNGETVRIAPWQLIVEKDGEKLLDQPGRSDLVSVRGASTMEDAIARVTPAQAGAYTFRCRLDAGNAIAETDEANNVAEFPVQVGATRATTPVNPGARGKATLGFAIPQGTHDFVFGAKQGDIHKEKLHPKFKWHSPYANDFDWQWQVALSPFPADANAPAPPIIRKGTVPINPQSVFSVNFETFPPLGKDPNASRTAGAARPSVAPDAPRDFFIRIVPMKAGKPAGPPSNTVIAHYTGKTDPAADAANAAITADSVKKQKLAEMNEQSTVYSVEILGFEGAIFPSRYGCVFVVKNEHFTKFPHPLASYEEGKEHCPPIDPSKQQKDLGDQIWEGISGYGHAWNGLAWFYDEAKDTAAALFAEVIVPCSLLKDLGEGAASTCEDIAKQVAATAIDVGLMAVGVPPTIPDLEGMSNLAKGEVVEAAVDYTCDAIESEGGKCTPAMREGLAQAYGKALDEMQKGLERQASEPHCGDVQGAKEQGFVALPCFSDYPGTEVIPGPSSVETSPAVKLRITRTRPDPFPMSCAVMASLVVRNDVAGFGKIEASLWPPGELPVSTISSVGGSSVVTLPLGPRKPWNSPVGKKGAIVEWYQIVSGGTGTLSVYGDGYADAQPPLPPGKVAVGCVDEPENKTLVIPKSFGDKTFPWKLQ